MNAERSALRGITTNSEGHPVDPFRNIEDTMLHMPDEGRTVYFFQCTADNELFAISDDVTGANILHTTCTDSWMLLDKSAGKKPVTVFGMPEPLLRTTLAIGYYVWRDACWAQRTAP